MSMILMVLAIFGIMYFLSTSNIQNTRKKRKRKKKSKDSSAAREVEVGRNHENSPALSDASVVSDKESSKPLITPNKSSESQVKPLERQESEILSTEEDEQSDNGEDKEWKRPSILVIKPSVNSNAKDGGYQLRKSKKDTIVLSKKQRQNLRKKEIEKSIKKDHEILQRQRLEKYRKDQEKEALRKLMK